jgi:membrane protein
VSSVVATREEAPSGAPPQPLDTVPARHGVRRVVTATLSAAWQHRVLGLAAEAGFWQVLSMPPLLLAVLGTLGYFVNALGPDAVLQIENWLVEAAANVLVPSAVEEVVRPSVRAVLERGRPDVISIGFLLALWSGSSGTATFVNTITIAYDLRDCRGAIRSRLLALWLYLGSVVFGVVMLPVLVLGPGILIGLADEHSALVETLVRYAYWPTAVLMTLAGLATLYHLAVPERRPWRRALPGAVLAMLLWLLGSYLLRVYLSVGVGEALSYGSLGAPVAVLLFFYITALAVLLGAELNAQLDPVWPRPRSRRRAR